jgi:hypothetical protein
MKTTNQPLRNSSTEVPKNRRGSHLNSFLAGMATILVLLLAGCGFLLYRAVRLGMVDNPFTAREIEPVVVPSNPPFSPPPISPTPTNEIIQPGQFVLPAFGDKAEVELTSVERLGNTNEVRVQMQVTRLADTITGEIIDAGLTKALGSDDNTIYEAIDPLDRSSGLISLADIPKGKKVPAFVILDIPLGTNPIDIVVENTGVFRKVPVAMAEPGSFSSTNNASTNSAQNSAANRSNPPKTSSNIQAGQFVQNAYGTKAEVELLSVKRIEDPQTGNRDVVNVQMRVRRLTEAVQNGETLAIAKTTARNPDTTETYNAVDAGKQSTGTVNLSTLRTGASADGYVWLRVPENVKTLNIYLPETAAFKNVPISE